MQGYHSPVAEALTVIRIKRFLNLLHGIVWTRSHIVTDDRLGFIFYCKLMTAITSVATATAVRSIARWLLPSVCSKQSHTWYKNRQQLFDSVHGADQHLSVLLVRQLLLPLLNHLWHFGHSWGAREKERGVGRGCNILSSGGWNLPKTIT